MVHFCGVGPVFFCILANGENFVSEGVKTMFEGQGVGIRHSLVASTSCAKELC